MKEEYKILSVTDRCAVDKYYRLKSKIQNRIIYFYDALQNSKSFSTTEIQWRHDKFLEFEEEYTGYIKLLDEYKIITQISAEDQLLYIKVYQKVNKWPDRKIHLKEILDIDQSQYYYKKLDPIVKPYVDKMVEDQKKNAIQSIQARMTLQLLKAYNDGHYIIFSTLTVNPESYDEVFKKNSSAWRNSIRNFSSTVTNCNNTTHDYIAVVEEGGETGRLHIHTLGFYSNVDNLKDPNTNKPIADDKDGIKELRPCWKYGYSTHYAVRFGEFDAFGQLGWKYPVEFNSTLKKYLPRKVSEIGKIVGYMSKYITKSNYNTKNKGAILWRTKMSRQFGTSKIQEVLKTLTIKQLTSLIIYNKYPKQIQIQEIPIPTKLMRRLAIKELIINRKNENYLHTKKKQEHFKNLLNYTTPKTQKSNTQSFTTILTAITSNMDICDKFFDDFVQAYQIINSDMNSYVTPVSCAKMVNSIKNVTI